MYVQTLSLSKEYVSLRYQTDNILLGAKDYANYETWNKDLTKIIGSWENLDKNAALLQKEALNSEKEISFNFIPKALAYDKNEISNVFDNAPAGRKIATLAKHLGVDSKLAFKILQQDQNQVTADAWNEAGNTLQNLETSATLIKDGCKVAGFVGTIAMTGGTSAIASGSVLANGSLIVSGADLVLEVTDDAAKIALGNHNKVSAIIGDARTVTEPLAGILAVANIPGNVSKGIEKLNVINFTAEQLNTGIQDGKIIGINIPEVKIELNDKFSNITKYKEPIYVAQLDPSEIDKWMKDNGVSNEVDTQDAIEEILNISEDKETAEQVSAENIESKKIEIIQGDKKTIGVYEGVMQNTSGGNHKVNTVDWQLTLKENGDATLNTAEENLSWKQEGDSIMLFGQDDPSSYYVFNLSGNTLVLVKMVFGGKEVLAGEDFMEGKAPVATLIKQK